MPKEKIVIGAAFFGKVWENVPDSNNGLYQPGKFKKSESIQKIDDLLKTDGYTYYWDITAQAPYIYNASKKLFITYDNKKSIEKKTRYALDKGLGGIMFWQLGLDYYKDGLLETIYDVKKIIQINRSAFYKKLMICSSALYPAGCVFSTYDCFTADCN